MDKYGYIGIETLLDFCENSKDHAVSPNDFMRMPRTLVERPESHWVKIGEFEDSIGVTTHVLHCQHCGALYRTRRLYTGEYVNSRYCPNCGSYMNSASWSDCERKPCTVASANVESYEESY